MKAKWLAAGCLVFICNLPATLTAAEPKAEGNPTIRCTLGEEERIYALEFSPDGKKLLAGVQQPIKPGEATDYQVVEWDLDTKSVNRKFGGGHSGQMRSLCYSPSGRYLAIGYLDGFVSVRDRTGATLLSFKSIENLLSPDLALVSICEAPRPVVYTIVSTKVAQARSIETGGATRIYLIQGSGYYITAAAGSRDGTTFACCMGESMNVYKDGDFDSGREIKSLQAPANVHTTVAISDDGTLAMTYAIRSGLALYDIKRDRLVKKWKMEETGFVDSIIPFHGLNWFATASGGEIMIWDEKGCLLARMQAQGMDRSIAALALTRDNSFLASSGEGRPIVVWDLRPLLRTRAPKGQ